MSALAWARTADRSTWRAATADGAVLTVSYITVRNFAATAERGGVLLGHDSAPTRLKAQRLAERLAGSR